MMIHAHCSTWQLLIMLTLQIPCSAEVCTMAHTWYLHYSYSLSNVILVDEKFTLFYQYLWYSHKCGTIVFSTGLKYIPDLHTHKSGILERSSQRFFRRNGTYLTACVPSLGSLWSYPVMSKCNCFNYMMFYGIKHPPCLLNFFAPLGLNCRTTRSANNKDMKVPVIKSVKGYFLFVWVKFNVPSAHLAVPPI